MIKTEQGDWEPFFECERGMRHRHLTSLEYLFSVFNTFDIKYRLDTTGENVNYLIIEDCQLIFSKENHEYIGTL